MMKYGEVEKMQSKDRIKNLAEELKLTHLKNNFLASNYSAVEQLK